MSESRIGMFENSEKEKSARLREEKFAYVWLNQFFLTSKVGLKKSLTLMMYHMDSKLTRKDPNNLFLNYLICGVMVL
jgi:hypothetical protein